MRIRERLTRGASETKGTAARSKAAGTPAQTQSASSPSDSIRLSGRGLEVQRARGLALQAPEIREGLVEEISGQVESGQYDVTGEDVAPKMIQEHLADVTR